MVGTRCASAPGSTSAADRRQLQLKLAGRLVVASRRWRAKIDERLKYFGQSDARWNALYLLGECPSGLVQTELADRIGISGPSVVKLLDVLEMQGLASRRSSPGDRRINIVVLEPRGREMLSQLNSVAGDLRDEMFQELSDVELKIALEVLTQLTERLQEPSAANAPFGMPHGQAVA